VDRVGRENMMPNIQAALERAKELHEGSLQTIAG
jgi:hypothetical protein